MKRNKRRQQFVHSRSTPKFMDFVKEYIATIALIIPIIPSLIYAGIFAYQYGHCHFFQISLSAYLGLSNSNIVTQSILIFSIGVGLLSLNALGYIINIKNRIGAILLLLLSPILLSIFTVIIANPSNFKMLFNAIAPFFIILSFVSFFPGICSAFCDQKSIKNGQKSLLYDTWHHNKIFKYFLCISPFLIIVFSLLFSVGYSSCFQIDTLYFTKTNGQEYAILYEGNDYYQLASTITDDADSQKKVIVNHQMRVEKNNLEIIPYPIKLSDLLVDN